MAVAIRLLMVNHRMSIAVLVFSNYVQPINPTFGAFTIHNYRDIVSRKFGSEIDRRRVVTATATKFHGGRSNMKGTRTFVLQTTMDQVRAMLYDNFHHCIRKVAGAAN